MLARHSFAFALTFALLASTAMPAVAATSVKKPATASTSGKSNDTTALLRALNAQAARLQEQEKKLADHEAKLDEQKRTLMQERLEFQKLQMQVSAVTGEPMTPISAAPPEKPKVAKEEARSISREQPEIGVDRKQSTEKPPEIAAVIEEGGVLLQKNKMVVTPAIEYSNSSATRVSIQGFSIIPALNVGLFDISRVKRDTITPSVGLRYGVTNRFELETKIPYVYRQDATATRPIGVANAPETLSTVDGMDIGDVEFGAHYQLNQGENGWPYLIGNMRFKTVTGTSPFEVPIVNGVQQELPTGSGFYALQPSVTAIFPSDPVVYYGNLGYLHSFAESFPGYGEIQPGDGISASFGMSLALNDKSSFSTGYSHTAVLKTTADGQNIPNSTVLQVGSLDFGYSYNLTDYTNINFTVSAGVTDDAPDTRLIFRVPITYDFN
jgi:hypothetical protein